MNHQHFDNYFHNTLAQHETEVPADMWNKISEQQRKKRGFLFWLKILGNGGAFLLFVLAVGYSWYTQPTALKSKLGYNPKLEKKHIVKSNDNTKTEYEIKAKTEGKIINAESIKTITPLIENGITKSVKNITVLVGKLNEMKASTAYFKKLTNELNKSKSTLNDKNNEQIPLATFNNNEYNKANIKWLNIEPISSNRNITNSNLACALEAYNTTASLIIDCPSVLSRPRRQLNIEAWLSPDYALNATHTNSLNMAYMQKKDSAERSSLSYSVGFRFSKEIARNIFAKLGFQYTQVDKKFSYKIENERRTVQVITLRNIVRAPGDTLRISDTSLFTQIGYLEKNSINHYRTIDIPVLISYNFQNNGWHFGATAGAIFNIHSWYKGETFDSSFTPVSIGKESGFKNNIGIGFYGSFHIAKDIGNKIAVYAEPYGRYNLSSLTNSQSLYNEKYHIIGLQLGIKYKIY